MNYQLLTWYEISIIVVMRCAPAQSVSLSVCVCIYLYSLFGCTNLYFDFQIP